MSPGDFEKSMQQLLGTKKILSVVTLPDDSNSVLLIEKTKLQPRHVNFLKHYEETGLSSMCMMKKYLYILDEVCF